MKFIDVNLAFLLAINGLAVAAATSMGEGCALNGTAIAAVLIDQ